MRRIICLLLVITTAILSGCGLARIPDAHVIDSNETHTEVKPAPSEPSPRFGGELRVPLTALDTFNPLLTQSRDVLNFLGLIFESPIAYDENLKPSPSLIDSWEVSPDGRLWIFDVRKGVKWHNGQDFTGEDILFTLEVLQSDMFDSLFHINHFEDIKIIEYGLRNNDPYTIFIRLGEPTFRILDYLTFPVLPKEIYQSDEFMLQSFTDFSLLPIGTGPYIVDQTHIFEGETIKLEKNENWWNGVPYIDSILGKSYDTNDEAREAFFNGEIDLVDTTVVYANTSLSRSNANVYKYLTSDYELLAFKGTHPLLQDNVIKKAIAYGIDRKDIISKVYLNNAETVDVPIPSNSWLYDSRYRIYDHDAQRAIKLLEEAGWKDNDGDGILDMEIDGTKVDLSFTILTNSDNSLRKDAAVLIAEQLANIGFDIQVEVLPWDLLLEERIITGEFDAILIGFSLEPMHDLRSFFHTDWMGEQRNNFLRYSSGELDQMLDSASKSFSEEDRAEIYQRIQKHFIDELPVVSLYFRTGSLMVDYRVRGIVSIGELDTFRGIKDWFLAQ